MITFGNDFFKWFAFVVQAIKLFISIFGDDEEKKRNGENHIEP